MNDQFLPAIKELVSRDFTFFHTLARKIGATYTYLAACVGLWCMSDISRTALDQFEKQAVKGIPVIIG